MSPAPPGTAAQLRQLIHYHLDNGFHENALFLAGRLLALEPRSADAAHLVALCNLRMGRYKAAYDVAKGRASQGQHLGCAYVYAQACLALERFPEGALALDKARGQWGGRNHFTKHSDTTRRHIPDAAACYCLLGKLWKGHGDVKKSVESYIEALTLNPFMWDAFTDLCDMGACVRPANIFKITPDILAAISHSVSNGHGAGPGPREFQSQESFEAKNPFISTPEVDPFNPPVRTGNDIGLNLGGSNLLSRLNGSYPPANGNGSALINPDETPTSYGQNDLDEDVMMGGIGGPVMNEPANDAPQAPGRKSMLHPFAPTEEPPKMRPITSRSRMKAGSESSEVTDIPRPIAQNGHKRTVSGHSTHRTTQQPADPTAAPPRRSARLLHSVIHPSSSRLGGLSRDPEARERRELRKVKATGTKGKTATTSTVGRVVSGNRKPQIEITDPSLKQDSRPVSAASGPPPPPKMVVSSDPSQDRQVLDWLLDLLLKIATGYAHLSRYDCTQALEAFALVPIQQRETPYVLARIGKAYYERQMHVDAEKVFQRIREKSPTHLDDMEVYANVLWQLKKETELAYLSHTLMDQDRLCPQTWCAIGNGFSLQREHDQAIKCFTRATQLDPKFAYAYTLQGHEHIANEEYDKALLAFRCAVTADKRHYNGWYGLGQVYEKLGKFDVAEKHYRAAVQINPTNALLVVKIGVVLDRMKKPQPALMLYTTAVSLDPRSNMARFRKAQLHLKLSQPHEALKDLEILKDSAPEDANVHFLLGRTYKRLGHRGLAVKHFTIAMNLDPKASQYVKESMEQLDDEEFGGVPELGEDWSSEGES